jgi:hypothetical protein
MRFRLHVSRWAVFGLGLCACLTPTDPGAQAAVDRMADEYNCHQGEMAVTSYAAGGYRVSGCGYTANYDCTYGRNVSTTCVKEAGSSPVPEFVAPPLPPPPDAGMK